MTVVVFTGAVEVVVVVSVTAAEVLVSAETVSVVSFTDVVSGAEASGCSDDNEGVSADVISAVSGAFTVVSVTFAAIEVTAVVTDDLVIAGESNTKVAGASLVAFIVSFSLVFREIKPITHIGTIIAQAHTMLGAVLLSGFLFATYAFLMCIAAYPMNTAL